MLIKNDVGLQIDVWTGVASYGPYQTDAEGKFQSTESKLRALAKGKPFGRTHYPAANTPFDRLAVGKFLSFDAQMTSLIMEALDDESSPHFPAGLRTTTTSDACVDSSSWPQRERPRAGKISTRSFVQSSPAHVQIRTGGRGARVGPFEGDDHPRRLGPTGRVR